MRHTKSERLFLSAAIVLALCLCVPASAGAMHIMEGYLPVGHCILWGAVCLPFLAWGLVSIKRIAAEHRKAILLLAMMWLPSTFLKLAMAVLFVATLVAERASRKKRGGEQHG